MIPQSISSLGHFKQQNEKSLKVGDDFILSTGYKFTVWPTRS